MAFMFNHKTLITDGKGTEKKWNYQGQGVQSSEF
jgi:hypothetical protein